MRQKCKYKKIYDAQKFNICFVCEIVPKIEETLNQRRYRLDATLEGVYRSISMMDADMDMGGNEPTKIARPCPIRTSLNRSKYKKTWTVISYHFK